MKVTLDDWQYGSYIALEPETLVEITCMARLAGNAKKERPTIRLVFPENKAPYLSIHFRKREPYLSIHFRKREPRQQKNEIKP